MGKKRKYELDLDVERNMYSSFVTAANAVSQLYTQGVQQQRRAAAAASRATLEKVVGFVLRDGSGGDHISKAALLQFLQHEYEGADSQDVPQPQVPQFMPFGGAATAAAPEDTGGHDVQQPKQPGRQMSGGMGSSPGLRGRMMGLDEHQLQQHQHQHHMQQQQHQQQHQHHQQADAMQHSMAQAAMADAPPFTGGPGHGMMGPPAMFGAQPGSGAMH